LDSIIIICLLFISVLYILLQKRVEKNTAISKSCSRNYWSCVWSMEWSLSRNCRKKGDSFLYFKKF